MSSYKLHQWAGAFSNIGTNTITSRRYVILLPKPFFISLKCTLDINEFSFVLYWYKKNIFIGIYHKSALIIDLPFSYGIVQISSFFHTFLIHYISLECCKKNETGAPLVLRTNSENGHTVSVRRGESATISLVVCADPRPRHVAWEWGSLRLEAGAGVGKLIALYLRYCLSFHNNIKRKKGKKIKISFQAVTESTTYNKIPEKTVIWLPSI